MIDQAKQLSERVGVRRACESLGLSRSTFYWRLRPSSPCSSAPRPPSARALSEEERRDALTILTSEAYVDKSPATIVASLLDQQVYVCSERTFYRILEGEQMSKERRDIIRHPVYSRPELLAQQPREVWSWDITKLKGPRKGLNYSLYVILDLYSRFVPGWLLAMREDDTLARMMLDEACRREGILPDQLTIHADNGGVMRSRTVSELYERLGVTRSHSRPHCSNDNPYSESQFKTMKYAPEFPSRFEGFDYAHAFCQSFFEAYNYEMYHSGIAMLTPAMVHHGHDADVIAQRQQTLCKAYADHPERFVNGQPKHKELPQAVWINKPMDDSIQIVNS